MSYSMSRGYAIRFLVEKHILEETSGNNESKAGVVRFDRLGVSMGSNPSAIKYCVLKVPKKLLIRLYNSNAPTDREYISALYSIGLGVPKNSETARFWKHAVYNNCKCEAYKHYRLLLKDHIKQITSNLKNYYVYSNDALKQRKLLEHIKCKKSDIKCAIVYKESGSGFKFHNVIIDGMIMIDGLKSAYLKVPEKLDCTFSSMKYVALLGTITTNSLYKLDIDVAKALRYVASDNCDEDLPRKLGKGITFNHKQSVTVDYRWLIHTLKRKLKL